MWSVLRRRRAIDDTRWVVLDVEASGLDARRDRLLAIAALALHIDGTHVAMAVGDSFEVVLRQEAPVADKANILLHGIGVGSQRAGRAPAQALTAFEHFIGDSPLLAFHAAYDRTLIERAWRATPGHLPPNPWLDIEHVAEGLYPEAAERTLDEWMARLGVRCARRHQAAADTWATAEVLLKLWPALVRQVGAPRFRAVARLAASRRWLRARPAR
jgi:DNA polymerase-3 subunit epsilon